MAPNSLPPIIHCDHCCAREHKDGTVTFHHQALGAVIVHPDQKCVVPLLPPEFIFKEDGATKNDCERNAAKRLTNDMIHTYSQYKFTITADALNIGYAVHHRCKRDGS